MRFIFNPGKGKPADLAPKIAAIHILGMLTTQFFASRRVGGIYRLIVVFCVRVFEILM